MQVSVFQDSILIGTGILEHLDPPMGVAFGPFTPSQRYDRDQHANTIEGKYFGDRGISLCVHADQHGPINSAVIAIDDYSDAIGERQLTVYFQDGDDFSAFFSQHAAFKAYYPQSD